MKRIQYSIYLLLLLTLVQPVYAQQVLRLSTTTSTENSGLLDKLNPVFERLHNVSLHVIAVGTGKALKIGANGDVDVVLVHAPAAEMEYVKHGDFVDRKAVMHNDFVIVGPSTDPANIAQAKTVQQALKKIAESGSEFISRGDDSGTHKKERYLWQQASVKAEGKWYLSIGQGMGAALRIADQKQAYLLTDRGTWIAFSERLSLKLLYQGDKELFNPYHVMAVNPKKFKQNHYVLARKYIEFLTGVEGQKLIAEFKKAGQQLFYPDALSQ